MTVEEKKECGVCKQAKPISEFYFRKDRNAYRGSCKSCKPLKSKAQIQDEVQNRTSKICKHCGIDKPLDAYQKAGGGKWPQPYCKLCDAERKKKHCAENAEKYVASKKAYYEQNKEVIGEAVKQYRHKNKETVTQWAAKYREENIETIRERGREYGKRNRKVLTDKFRERRQANPDYFKAKGKAVRERKTPEQIAAQKKYLQEYRVNKKDKLIEWANNNRPKLRERRRVYNNHKSATDPVFKITKNMRTRIRSALKRWDTTKCDSTQALLGCTIQEFKVYFENLFTEGMTWDLFMKGQIHVDHVKPCALFDLTDEQQQRECFSYRNLQPLFKEANLKKGAKYQPNIL